MGTLLPPVRLYQPLIARCVGATFANEGTVLRLDCACLIEGDFIVEQPDNEQWVQEITLTMHGGQKVWDWKPRGLMFTVDMDSDAADSSLVSDQ